MTLWATSKCFFFFFLGRKLKKGRIRGWQVANFMSFKETLRDIDTNTLQQKKTKKNLVSSRIKI